MGYIIYATVKNWAQVVVTYMLLVQNHESCPNLQLGHDSELCLIA